MRCIVVCWVVAAMTRLWRHLLLICLRFYSLVEGQEFTKIDEYYYNLPPAMDPYIEGSSWKVPDKLHTPDYRVEEPQRIPHYVGYTKEVHRPYRISPHYKQVQRQQPRAFLEHLEFLGCYCCTVYKRLTPLAGCAVITSRHILTTATSTELVLGGRRHFKTMEGILGAWYDTYEDTFNSSLYMTPARIHYHPRYLRPHLVNISHPLPVVMDLAVWAATYTFLFEFTNICPRGGSSKDYFTASTPKYKELLMIVGFQFMRAWNRRPTPFHKYFLRTRQSHFEPCPKQDWGWFHCVRAPWFKLGVESGGALHMSVEGYDGRNDGFIGLNAFSIILRTKQIVHYFTVVDTHAVLNFLYSAYMGRQPYEFLDERFYDSQFKAPVIKPWYVIPHLYTRGEQKMDYYNMYYW